MQTRHTGKASASYFTLLFMLIPFTFYPIYFSIIIFFSTIDSLFWEKTDGILKQKEPTLIYTYKVDGKDYESSTFDSISIVRRQDNMRSYDSKDYTIDQNLKVYYNSKTHEESVISRKLDINVGGLILFMSLVNMIFCITYRKKPLKILLITTAYSLLYIAVSVILSLIV